MFNDFISKMADNNPIKILILKKGNSLIGTSEKLPSPHNIYERILSEEANEFSIEIPEEVK